MTDPSPSFVSVVMPVFNGARHLAVTLEAAFAQDHPRFEVIVVDDGSTDESGTIARRFPVRYVAQTNQGPGAARNRGIQEAQGAYIAFLDHDDHWLPGFLRTLAAWLDAHPACSYILARQRWFLEEGVARPKWLKPEWLAEPQDGYLPSALMARRETFATVGLFDTSYETASDSDWFFRAVGLGLAPCWVREVLVHHRFHESNQSYEGAKIQAELLRLVRRNLAARRGKGAGS